MSNNQNPSSEQQTFTLQQALEFAVQHHNSGRLPQAETIYQEILQSNPNHPIALHLLGVIAHQMGKHDKAVDQITKALSLKPDYAEAHNNLGNALKDLGKLEEAVASFRKALALKPDMAEAHYNLGNALKDLGKPEDAAASYHKALALRPDYADAHNNLGNALKDLGKLEEAVSSYHKALELNPNDINASVSLANNSDRLVPFWHIPMMNDLLRNEAYLAALQTAVTADTHVLEIGTGSGLLAMMAARCCAEQVTTCEASPLIAATAKEIISTNGMANTINVIVKKSTNLEMGVDLPRPADLLVFEIFSSEFLAEGVLSSVEDAKRRLLNPEGRIIPSGGSIMVALFGGNHVGQNFMVDEVSGFDMSKFNSITSKRKFFQANHFDIKLLTDDVEAFSFDFNENNYFAPEKKILKISITTAAKCYGIIQWNRMQMDDLIIFENHPSIKTTASSWSHVAYLFDKPIGVKPHQTAIVSATHNRDLPWFALDDIAEP